MPTLESSADKAYMLDLPKVSFRVITDDKSLLSPAGVHSEQSRSYGYNDFSDFERPEYYIRYIEPIESELAVQVEYDMDEQDQEWLDAINNERKKEQSGPISHEVFEIIMDKLEKEWFDLIKRIPQPVSHLPVEDSKCSICDDGEGENSNAIVFCDGCNLAVHQDCYGVPYIPEGQWLCRKCTVSPENPVSCLFCPNEGGAFKQTSSGHWSHLLCAIWIPELGVGNTTYMEPVDGVEVVPKNRWKLICSLCREKVGACIQCDNRNCFTAFHVTCARQLGLLQTMKSITTDGVLRAYCEKHLPADSRDGGESDIESVESDIQQRKKGRSRGRSRGGSHNLLVPVTTKSARAHAKSYRPGPPLVPQMIVKRLLDYVTKIAIRKRQPFIERLCRYWSLKREARRGAPLLKRLHLEPWTASPATKQESEAEKQQKMKFLARLRNDLEKVRMLAELVRKREREKLRQVQVIKDVVDGFIFPQYAKLRLILEKISAMDRTELFLNPVNKLDVPDYFDTIKEPRCWLYIDEQLEKNAYRHVADFKRDIVLVLDNACTYNSPETLFHRTATRIKKNAIPLLDELEDVAPSTENDLAGDLESSIPLLQALSQNISEDPTKPQDYLASIFAFELEAPRLPTPPPPEPTPPKLKKRTTEAERKQRWADKEARAKDRLPGGGRTTRAADTLIKAFENEGAVEPMDMATPRGSRKTRGRKGEEQGMDSTRSSPAGTVKPMSKPQRGVVGIETLAILSDKERREQERRLDLVTSELDAKDAFKRFNVGWVLPEGSRRRTLPAPIERPAPIPRKKKSESRAQETPTTNLVALPDKVKTDTSSDSGSLTPPPSSSASETSLKQSSPVAHPVVEALSGRRGKRKDTDTPSRNPSPNKRLRGDTAQSSSRLSTPASFRRRSPRKNEDPRVVPQAASPPLPDGSSELSEAVEELEEVKVFHQPKSNAKLVQAGRSSKKRNSKIGTAPSLPPRQHIGDDEDPYPPGTLVWAKMPSFPFFPANALDPDADDIPQSVLSKRPSSENRIWLVQFFDTYSSFGWIPADKLDLLGEDDGIDQLYLAGKARDRPASFKNTNVRNDVRKAFRDAQASLVEVDVEEEPIEG